MLVNAVAASTRSIDEEDLTPPRELTGTLFLTSHHGVVGGKPGGVFASKRRGAASNLHILGGPKGCEICRADPSVEMRVAGSRFESNESVVSSLAAASDLAYWHATGMTPGLADYCVVGAAEDLVYYYQTGLAPTLTDYCAVGTAGDLVDWCARTTDLSESYGVKVTSIRADWNTAPQVVADSKVPPSCQVSEAAEQVLARTQGLRQLLDEALARLSELFPQGTFALVVESFFDQHSPDTHLYLVVTTSQQPDEALALLERFDNEWWLDALPRSRGIMSVTLEYA